MKSVSKIMILRKFKDMLFLIVSYIMLFILIATATIMCTYHPAEQEELQTEQK